MAAPRARAAAHGFEQDHAALDELTHAWRTDAHCREALLDPLRKFLAHKNNFLVSKAAKLAQEAELAELTPALLAAYERFFIDAVRTDPQCWAKIALAQALAHLEHREKAAYLLGLRHHQMEAVWGGTADTAGTLRTACAHALVDCPGLTDLELLSLLLEALTDLDPSVQREAARDIGAVGGSGAVLTLRFRLLLGLRKADAEEAPLLGACLASLLVLDEAEALPLAREAVRQGGDFAVEAAYALADQRSPQAFAVLREGFEDRANAELQPVLLGAMAQTRLPEAQNYLLDRIAAEDRCAAQAIEALCRVAPDKELLQRLDEAVASTGSPRLRNALREHQGKL